MSELTKLENDVLDAVTAYLIARGWSVAVIGGMKITQPDPLVRAYHYDFSVGFTGRMPAELEARTTLEASERGGGE